MDKGCPHYHSDLDIVAIKFKCCGRYYPCYICHLEGSEHPAQRWNSQEFHEKALLCRKCKRELTISEYFKCNHQCPCCNNLFNPGCKNHWDLYFES